MENKGVNDDRNILSKYIPLNKFEVTMSCHPVYVYKHMSTGLPMACVAGCYKGVIVGGIIWFRYQDNSMNMEIEFPMEQAQSTFTFLDSQMKKPDNVSVEDVYDQFMKNLVNRLAQKLHPVVVEKGQQQQPPPKNNDPEPVNKKEKVQEEEPALCMICLDKKPDTLVMPCGHSVVCAECSSALEKTRDSRVCCQCRCEITSVYFPDNSVKLK